MPIDRIRQRRFAQRNLGGTANDRLGTCVNLALKFLAPFVFEACYKSGISQELRGIVAG